MRTSTTRSFLCWILLAAVLAGCSDDDNGSLEDPAPEPAEAEIQEGYEIIEALAPNRLRAWATGDMTREEFEALELPNGWFKNQPRELGEAVEGPDGSRFIKSPDTANEGEFQDEELFGFQWRHVATILQTGRPMDEEGILTGSSVNKFHELTFNAGSTVVLLISPEGSVYFRIGRDSDRTTDDPTIPADWRLMDYETPVDLVFTLAPRNTVIRTDNEDSFQGPVRIEELIASGEVPDPFDIAPLELTTDICDDATNMAIIQDSLIWQETLASNGGNIELANEMIADPTRGPFYMLNLIRFREFAEYEDGRETNLTGREANDLYSPVEFLGAIGAGPVFYAPVAEQLEGDAYFWQDVALVEYPCPAGFFAMATNPDFLDRLVHKNAAVENHIVAVTYLRTPTANEGEEPADNPFANIPGDRAFEYVQVLDFSDIAQYDENSGEPERTGAQAWAEFQAAESNAAAEVGATSTAILDVQGVFQGVMDNPWDEVHFVSMPSMAGFEALQADAERQAGLFHREAAIANAYSMITYPFVNNIPGGDEDENAAQVALPITETGVGTPCSTDADCAGIGFCLSGEGGGGFCSRICGSGECGDGYTCCSECSPIAADLLPFSESACIVEAAASQLSNAPLSCSCQ